MSKIQISGRILHIPGTWGSSIPVQNASVEIIDIDSPLNSDDVIWSGNTDNEGKFSGLSNEWQDTKTIRVWVPLPFPGHWENKTIPDPADVLLLKLRVKQGGSTHEVIPFANSSPLPVIVPWGPPPVSTRRALCVGINQFKNYPSSALQGCVNDAKDMSKLLQKLLGFQSNEITMLTDAQATKANIINNLKAMVDGAKAGRYTYLVFSMSSHGTQVPDLSGDEPDRADEAFCPYDLATSGNQWDKNYIIVDDELRDIFIQLPSNVLLEVYLDTCHSGTGLKAIDMLPDRCPRYLPPPSLEAFKEVENKRSRGLRHGLLEKGIVHHILWSACRSDQTSADANIAGGWHGAFTYYFCKLMYACNNSLSRSQILAQVRTALAASQYSQVPQLEVEATKRMMKIE